MWVSGVSERLLSSWWSSEFIDLLAALPLDRNCEDLFMPERRRRYSPRFKAEAVHAAVSGHVQRDGWGRHQRVSRDMRSGFAAL